MQACLVYLMLSEKACSIPTRLRHPGNKKMDHACQAIQEYTSSVHHLLPMDDL